MEKFIDDMFVRYWNHGITKTYQKKEGQIRLNLFPPIPDKADAKFVETALAHAKKQIEQKAELSKHKKLRWEALAYAHKKATKAFREKDFYNACVAFMELGLCAAEINQISMREKEDSTYGIKSRKTQERRIKNSISPAADRRRGVKEIALEIGDKLIKADNLQQLRKAGFVEKVRSELEQMFDDGRLNELVRDRRYIPKSESIRKWFTETPEYLSKPGPKSNK